ncbi:hypothetical protein THOG05_50074 [Vibrio rotiferianus]|nr:hypothetical protein THOG05_50074 [Vibrio rotiferianus]
MILSNGLHLLPNGFFPAHSVSYRMGMIFIVNPHRFMSFFLLRCVNSTQNGHEHAFTARALN